MSCHTTTDQPTMHSNPARHARLHRLPRRRRDGVVTPGRAPRERRIPHAPSKRRTSCRVIRKRGTGRRAPSRRAHLHAAQPRESPEFIRFINPGDYRVAREACGACHMPIIAGGRAQPDGDRRDVLGRRRLQQRHPAVQALHPRRGLHARTASRRMLADPASADADDDARSTASCRSCQPLPRWETVPAGRHLPRVRARRAQRSAPVSRDRPAERDRASCSCSTSRAGPTSAAVQPRPGHRRCASSMPVLNIAQDAPQRSAHVVPRHQRSARRLSLLGLRRLPRRLRQRPRPAALRARTRSSAHRGTSFSSRPDDPARTSPGHPLKHAFTRSIPTSQCMVCHMHQPNMFVNSFLGYTMWDYESDAPLMWPEKQQISRATQEVRARPRPQPRRRGDARQVGATSNFLRQGLRAQPAAARTRSSPTITAMAGISARSSSATARATCSMRKGNIVADDDPQKFKKAVHLSSIHVDVGHAMRRLPFRAGQSRQRPHLRRGRQARSRSTAPTATAPSTQLPEPATSRPGRAAGRHRLVAAAQRRTAARVSNGATASCTSARRSTPISNGR